MSVRVRFAPSPTGYLHIGGVRTALYSWLWARRHGGQFVLRIEDTDAERSTDESIEVILESMRWLGLDWDEGPGRGGDHGPYRQTERTAIYRQWAEKLVASGHAYRCFATREEIQSQREAYEKEHGAKGFRFRSPWRDRVDGHAVEPHVIRFKTPAEGTTGWDDLLRGPIEVGNREQQDFVLLRGNGLPLYNFGCFVDDLTMDITLVARGDDHMVNTPQQLLLYRAVGAEPPRFAHLPMVLGPDGKKLSKRHAAVSVLDYRDLGYVPDGLINYLARLGWSHGDQEIFTREELVSLFDWAHVGKTASRYDKKKLAHVQSHHLRALSNERLAELVVPFMARRGLTVDPAEPRLVSAIGPVKLRVATLDELADGLDYFFREDASLTYDAKGRRKFLTPDFAGHLSKLADIASEAQPFDEATLEAQVSAWVETDELKMKNVAQPARVALTGRTASPGLYETMVLLGREATVRRLRRGIDLTATEPPKA